MQAKVSVRLGLVFGLVIFLFLAVSYIFQGRQLRELFIQGIRNDLQRELKLNRELLRERPPEWSDITQSDRWADRVGAALEVRVTVIDTTGTVIGDSYVDAGRLAFIRNHLDRPEIVSALKNGVGESVRFSDTTGSDMLYIAMPVGFPRPYAVIRFAKPLRDIRRLEAEVNRGIEAGLFLALLLSLVAGALSAFFLSRPLENIAETADRFLNGESTAKIPVRRSDEIGRLSRAFNYMSDEITRMSRQEEWLMEVLSSIREAIIVTNADGDIVLVNRAASNLFFIEGALNRSMPVKQIADRSMQQLLEKVHASGNRQFKEELSIMTRKGERMLKITAVPVMKGARYDGTVLVINDITRLRNLEKVRRDFVASVSHELRTPLASISGYTETLLEGAVNDPEHAVSFLRIILHETVQLTALINDVLDLSKIESGKIVYSFKPVDLTALVEKAAALFSQAAEKKGIKITVAIARGLPPVLADAVYLDIVIRNLIDNAVKYIDHGGGMIRISAFRSGDLIALEVEDNGPGISRQDLDRIFERFYRVDKARSRELGGTGLGLSIVKHIVLAHKGKVEVRSRLNHGSVFTVTLPLANDEC